MSQKESPSVVVAPSNPAYHREKPIRFEVGTSVYHELAPSNGKTFDLTTNEIIWEIPVVDIIEEKSAGMLINLAVASAATTDSLVKAPLDVIWGNLKITSDGRLISNEDHYGFRRTKQAKFEQGDSLANSSAVNGYNTSATQIGDAVYSYISYFDERSFMGKEHPMFLLEEHSKIKLTFTLNPNYNEYTQINAGTDVRTVTITNPRLFYRLINAPDLMAHYNAVGFRGTYVAYHGSRKQMDSGATEVTISHTPSKGRFQGSESYIMLKASLTTHTLHTKIWNDIKDNLSSISVLWGGEPIASKRDITNISTSMYAQNLAYRNAKHLSHQSSAVWADADTFCVCIPVSAVHSDKALSGFNNPRKYELTLNMSSGASADLYVYTFFKVQHGYYYSPSTGRLEIDDVDFK